MTKGFCVKCKKMVEMEKEAISKTKKGTRITKGKCPICNTKVCRMLGK